MYTKRKLQIEKQTSSHNIHRRAASSAAGELRRRIEPGRTRPRTHRANHRPEQTSHSSVVPKLARTSKEVQREEDGLWK